MSPSDNMGRFIVFWFLANLMFIMLWDIIMIALGRQFSTVSYQMYALFQKFPLFYLLAGTAIGHLLVPLVIHLTPPNNH